MSDLVVYRFFAAWALVLGACLGSFLNVCIVRWAEDRKIVSVWVQKAKTRIDTLDAQAALLVGDLLNPDSPYRAGFLAFLKRCMRGGGSEPQFREALGIDSLGVQALDFEYWSARLAWLHRLLKLPVPIVCQ